MPDHEEPLWHQEYSVLDALRRPETASKEDPDSLPRSDTQRSLWRAGGTCVTLKRLHATCARTSRHQAWGSRRVKAGAASGLPERLFRGQTLIQPVSYQTSAPRILIDLLRAQTLKWDYSPRPLFSRL